MHDCENSNGGLEKAGVRHVCFQIWPIDESVIRNHKAFREQGTLNWFRSRGFKVGGFTVNYFQPVDEAKNTVEQLDAWDLDFLVADIEHHKADMPGGNMALTETLAAELPRPPRRLPDLVRRLRAELRALGGQPRGDGRARDRLHRRGYNENGYSDGVVAGMQKITRENRVPADIVPREQEPRERRGHGFQLRSTAGSRLRDVWLWRPESGEAQTDLIAGVDLVP